MNLLSELFHTMPEERLALLKLSLCALLCVALCVNIGQALYSDWAALSQADHRDSAHQPAIDSKANTVDLQSLLDAHLFGRADVKPTMDAPPPPETQLQLELKGLFYNSQSSRSSALVAEPSQKAKLYRLGDTLPGSAILSKITPTHIELTRNDRPETLYLSSTKPRLDSTAKTNSFNGVGRHSAPATEAPPPPKTQQPELTLKQRLDAFTQQAQ